MEIQLWRNLLSPYELAVRELVVKFNHIITEHKEKDLYSPMEQVIGRVKSIASILEKMQRKGIPFDRLEAEVEDLGFGEFRAASGHVWKTEIDFAADVN